MDYIKLKRRLVAVIVLMIFLLWTLVLYKFSPNKIAEFVGIGNGYILSFALAFIGGTSLFFPFPYYLVVMTFGAAGLNPYLLGLSAGLGVVMGDSTSYLIGRKSREILPSRVSLFFTKFLNWCMRKASYFITIVLFLYSTFVPLPNDVLVIPLGIAHFPYWKMIIPLAIGNIIFSTMMAFAGFHGWNLFFG